jgi:hypothetical protein
VQGRWIILKSFVAAISQCQLIRHGINMVEMSQSQIRAKLEVQISPHERSLFLKVAYFKEILYLTGRFQNDSIMVLLIGSMFGVNMQHVGTMFQEDMTHVGCMLRVC